MAEPLCQPLSKVRHDLNLLPKQFETNPLPVLVEQYGKPVFAIVPIEIYLVMEAAMDFIKEHDQVDKFEDWMEEEGIFSDNDSLEDDLEAEEDDSLEESSFDLLKSEGLLEDPTVRQSMREHCLKTLAKLDAYDQITPKS